MLQPTSVHGIRKVSEDFMVYHCGSLSLILLVVIVE